ncbi:DUF2946 domain-containing protein [Ideonella sp. A 288]|uniref:DUF2946 domain-containing protein n=1 Tax=Ideonella sp. A 288 TaxID=1962181 RepID=UPI001303D673|nr:DUF2946 domain-containing protein [Ideonella sp. A 288]
MTIFRRHRRAWAWIALFALLGLSLAPTLSHALALSASHEPWHQICTAHGPEPSAAAAGAPTPQPAHGDPLAHLEHCPFCALGGVAPLLPTPAGAGLPVVEAADACPTEPGALPARQVAWRAAPARAPPLGSTHR